MAEGIPYTSYLSRKIQIFYNLESKKTNSIIKKCSFIDMNKLFILLFYGKIEEKYVYLYELYFFLNLKKNIRIRYLRIIYKIS